MERYSINDLIRIGLRRFFWVFIPFTIMLAVGLVALNEVPARYQSKATLIVADQQVSETLVQSAIQALAQDRLETIKQQVRARDNVIALAQQFDLFDRQSKQPFSAQVADVRNDIRISIEKVSTRRRNQPTTITFEIGFVHENPRTAFRVANQLVTDFLDQNVESRIEAAEGTAVFFRDEARDLRRQLADVRQEIAAVREENPGLTPDAADLTLSLVQRLTQEIDRAEERIEASNAELSLVRMQQPLIIDANERGDLERVTLREKRRQLSALRSQYTDSYPEVIRVQAEVLDLEARLDPDAYVARANEILADLNGRIANREGLSTRELQEMRERRDRVTQQLAEVRRTGGDQSLARLQFETNEATILQRLRVYTERLESLRTELDEVEGRLVQMPAVAAQIGALKSDESRIIRALDESVDKLAEAERSENLEEQQKAERVEILESPVMPDVPTSPNKPQAAVMIAGVAGGIAGALGLLPIFLFPRIDSGRQLGQSLPGVTVVEVPEIIDEEEQKFRRMVLIALVALSILLTAACAFLAYKVLV
ncbi:hypothetical protein HK107_04575 [Parvularcula sp. ZS-1/3]|uniref:Lipopolysaccharide biosynthesis protein n=1 Tax=Parvularcula mediterranea TaxID=2732508 RepID=A0A7Y3W4L9_9PROT|nr:hypothetical protein [Parvularcula mediterranea]NNU15593.1 hypothetical protein [Parvularcula mediterranea]